MRELIYGSFEKKVVEVPIRIKGFSPRRKGAKNANKTASCIIPLIRHKFGGGESWTPSKLAGDEHKHLAKSVCAN